MRLAIAHLDVDWYCRVANRSNADRSVGDGKQSIYCFLVPAVPEIAFGWLVLDVELEVVGEDLEMVLLT